MTGAGTAVLKDWAEGSRSYIQSTYNVTHLMSHAMLCVYVHVVGYWRNVQYVSSDTRLQVSLMMVICYLL